MSGLVRDEAGSMAVLTILLLPMILAVAAGVLELGLVRLVAERARIAADLAAVVAVNDQDEAELARTGGLRLAPDAEDVARAHFAVGLAPLARALAAAPEAVAAGADIAVIRSPGEVDPRSGRTHGAPTVRIAADLPIDTPAFAAMLGRPITVVRIWSASSAR